MQADSPQSGWATLPDLLAVAMLEKLNVLDIRSLRLVCKTLKAVLDSNLRLLRPRADLVRRLTGYLLYRLCCYDTGRGFCQFGAVPGSVQLTALSKCTTPRMHLPVARGVGHSRTDRAEGPPVPELPYLRRDPGVSFVPHRPDGLDNRHHPKRCCEGHDGLRPPPSSQANPPERFRGRFVGRAPDDRLMRHHSGPASSLLATPSPEACHCCSMLTCISDPQRAIPRSSLPCSFSIRLLGRRESG